MRSQQKITRRREQGQGNDRRAVRREGRCEKGAQGDPAGCGIHMQLGALPCHRKPHGVPFRSPSTGRRQDGKPLIKTPLLRQPCAQAARPGPLLPLARPPALRPCLRLLRLLPRLRLLLARRGLSRDLTNQGVPQGILEQGIRQTRRSRRLGNLGTDPPQTSLRSGARCRAASRNAAAGTSLPGAERAGRGASAGARPAGRERREPTPATPRSGGHGPTRRWQQRARP